MEQFFISVAWQSRLGADLGVVFQIGVRESGDDAVDPVFPNELAYGVHVAQAELTVVVRDALRGGLLDGIPVEHGRVDPHRPRRFDDLTGYFVAAQNQ